MNSTRSVVLVFIVVVILFMLFSKTEPTQEHEFNAITNKEIALSIAGLAKTGSHGECIAGVTPRCTFFICKEVPPILERGAFVYFPIDCNCDWDMYYWDPIDDKYFHPTPNSKLFSKNGLYWNGSYNCTVLISSGTMSSFFRKT